MTLVRRPEHFNDIEQDEGSTPSHPKISQWAASSVVERLIRIQETRVRFSASPPFQRAASSIVEHLNGIEETSERYRTCPPFMVRVALRDTSTNFGSIV